MAQLNTKVWISTAGAAHTEQPVPHEHQWQLARIVGIPSSSTGRLGGADLPWSLGWTQQELDAQTGTAIEPSIMLCPPP